MTSDLTAALARALYYHDPLHVHAPGPREPDSGVRAKALQAALAAEGIVLVNRERLSEELVDIIEQAIFETDTGLAAALLASERISAALEPKP
jgi:hypothetical protein